MLEGGLYSGRRITACIERLVRQDKTRQDNVLFGVLYNPMYMDLIQII